MWIKFFERDVIGKAPRKVGDQFRALFLGRETLFEVVEIRGDTIMAIFVV